MKDTLFVLKPGFEQEGERYFCPYSAQLIGMLTYYPELRATLELVELDFAKPRRPLSDLLGEEHQAPPTLVLGNSSVHEVPGVSICEANGHRFIPKTLEILRYLAVTRGLPLPH